MSHNSGNMTESGSRTVTEISENDGSSRVSKIY